MEGKEIMAEPMMQVPAQPVQPSQIYAASMQEEKVKTMLESSSPDRLMLDLQWRIKGYVLNPYTKRWEQLNKGDVELSPLLISRYLSFASSLVGENTRWAALTDGEINNLMVQAIEWVTDDLSSNAIEYNLCEDYSERSRIGIILLNATFVTLKRAQNGIEAKHIFDSLNMHENLGGAAGGRGDSILDKLKRIL